MEPREDSNNQSIAITKEVFGVTENSKVLVDFSTLLMSEFVQKNGEIGTQVLMERAPRIPSDTYDRSYINAGTPSGSNTSSRAWNDCLPSNTCYGIPLILYRRPSAALVV